MNAKPDQPEDAARLRGRAEERLKRQKTASAGRPASVETDRLVHELQVHQIELELQNEELKQTQTQREELLAQYTDLYEFAPVGYLALGRGGVIQRINLAGARLLGAERSRLAKQSFRALIAHGDRGIFDEFLQKVFAGQAKACCEVALAPSGPQSRLAHIEGVRSADGRECAAVMLDCTERKQAEAKIAEQLAELRRWRNAMVGCESRTLSVKQEVNELLARLGEPPRYPSALAAPGGPPASATAPAGDHKNTNPKES